MHYATSFTCSNKLTLICKYKQPSVVSMALASAHHFKYDVFLSFQGDDTRKNFVDHLYSTLHSKGVYAFKDDKELERGRPIAGELLQAIKDSRFCIVVFSKRYAGSTWCLDELVTIFECVEQGKQLAFPVFYGVDPFDVQALKGEYGKAFAAHEQIYEAHKVQKWKVAITVLATLSGWNLQNRHEVEFINDIVEGILGQLTKARQSIPRSVENGLVGMDKHWRQLDSYLCENRNDVCVIGICGMGGIGKTTIARALFNKLSSQFEGSSFLANVREVAEKHGLVRLQEQLLSEIALERNLRVWDTDRGVKEIENRLWHRKVLLVLDDVDSLEQLKSLAGKFSWFGSGSKILITTRDGHLLKLYEESIVYKVSELNHSDAHQLFCLKAFGSGSPSKNFEDISHSFVEYCNGLPLAIDVLGSFLHGLNSRIEWESTLHRLKKIPNRGILNKLKISFDGLEEIEQKIFLDIACFFKGSDVDCLKRILRTCDFHPDIGMRVLIDKSLITINSDNQVCMHDLLQRMGREIVRQQSPEEPGKRSRLWLCNDVYQVLLNNTGTEMIEGIMIEDMHKQEVKGLNVEALSAKAFFKMQRLRLLKLQYLHVRYGFEFLPNSLRYLDWHESPSKSLPAKFQPDKLIELHMCYSSIKLLWKGTKPLKKLKVIDLRHSKNLEKTPDFREVLELEELNLEGCTRLFEVHHSIGVLKELILLNLKNCKSLTILPSSISGLKSLKILNLSGCSKLCRLPETLGELTSLQILNLGGVSKNERSIAKQWDFFRPWRRIMNSMSLTLPSSLSNLCSLRGLDLSYNHLKEGLPNDLSCFPLLEQLNLSGNDFVNIPTCINRLSKLVVLRLVDCRKLKSIPEFPSSVEYMNMNGCISMESFPCLFEYHGGNTLWIDFGNCFKLIKKRCKDNIFFQLLTSYLQFLLKMKHNEQELKYRESHFSLTIPGRAIPRWFNFWSPYASLTVLLPLNWCNAKWIGFAICGIWCADPYGRKPGTYFFGCDLRMKIDGVSRTISTFSIHKELQVTSDHLWVVFAPMALVRSRKRSVELWNTVKKIEISCRPNGLNVNSWGFRIVYEQDIEELVQCNSPKNHKFLTIS